MIVDRTLGGGFATAEGVSFIQIRCSARQLAGNADGRAVWGPRPDRDEAVRVLRAAVEAGVDHVDTAPDDGVTHAHRYAAPARRLRGAADRGGRRRIWSRVLVIMSPRVRTSSLVSESKSNSRTSWT
jgi:hypothetical protein